MEVAVAIEDADKYEGVDVNRRVDRTMSDSDQLTCEWYLDDATDSCLWQTSCGQSFQFTDGSVEDNQFKFCYYCGRSIKPVRGESEF